MPRLYKEDELPLLDSIENIRGLNLEVVKLTTIQVTRQPLQLKICKIGMICSAKLILTEDYA
jgi:hypothetical protein